MTAPPVIEPASQASDAPVTQGAAPEGAVWPWQSSVLNAVALVAGLVAGRVLGPHAALLKPLAALCGNLLKMLLLPFIVTSLISGMGGLSSRAQTRLLKAGLLCVPLFIAAGLAVVWSVARLFPSLSNAAFYTGQGSAVPTLDVSAHLVPANLFDALAKGTMPGIVLFCALFGRTLAATEEKHRLLDWVALAFHVVRVQAREILRFWPIAVFLLSATSMSELGPMMLNRDVHGFLIAVAVASVVLVLGIFPLVVMGLLGVRYMRVLQAFLPSAVLAFVSGIYFVAVPEAVAATSALLAEGEAAQAAGGSSSDADEDVDTAVEASALVPFWTAVPMASSALVVLFALYAAAAWDRHLTLFDYARIGTVDLLSLFYPPMLAARLLITDLKIPVDALDLLQASLEVFERFRAIVQICALIALTVTVHTVMRSGWRRPVRRLVVVTMGFAIPLALVSQALSPTMAVRSARPEYYASMGVQLPASVRVVSDLALSPEPAPPSGLARLRRGEPLRLGVVVGRMPFAYRQPDGRLSGLSVELAAMLASDLDGRAVLVEVDQGRIVADFDAGRVDVLMSPLLIDSSRLLALDFGAEFARVSAVLLHQGESYTDMADRAARDDWSGVRVAALEGSPLQRLASALLPGAVIVPVSSIDEALFGTICDAALWTDLEAVSWEVQHPTYDETELPRGKPLVMAWPFRHGDVETRHFFDTWLEVRKAQGDLERLTRKWVQGRR